MFEKKVKISGVPEILTNRTVQAKQNEDCSQTHARKPFAEMQTAKKVTISELCRIVTISKKKQLRITNHKATRRSYASKLKQHQNQDKL